MTDNTITGRAKKFDGTAIDYVSIFNWVDGACIAQVVPDASGNWQYSYNRDLEVGLTYVADGCEPITHGAYDFNYQAPAVVIPTDYILAYDFNGDLLDKSVNGLNGVKTGNANFVAGRKVGTQALDFVQAVIKTPSPVPIRSDKLTVSFWISTSQTTRGMIYETTIGTHILANSHYCAVNFSEAGVIDSIVRSPPRVNAEYNGVASVMSFDRSYQHVIIEIDRSKDVDNENRIYINNVLSSYLNPSYRKDTDGLLDDGWVWHIGARQDPSNMAFVGRLQDFRVYKRLLTADERTALFNE